MNQNLRESIDMVRNEGYTVGDVHGEDQHLTDPLGDTVGTWRDKYPYDTLLGRDRYEAEKRQLQIELLEFQYPARGNGAKHTILFEERDVVGEGGAIKRFTGHLNSCGARVMALTKLIEKERGQQYSQCYIEYLPTVGEVVPSDHSWHNRAGVERVMGLCAEEKYRILMKQAPVFERMFIESGITVTKSRFSVTQRERRTRFAIRQLDPMRRWKFSPMDPEPPDRWRDYTQAKTATLKQIDTETAPWHRIKSNDKERARLNVMRLFLGLHGYGGRDPSVIKPTDSLIAQWGRKKWTKKNADGEIVQPDGNEDWCGEPDVPPPMVEGGNRSRVQRDRSGLYHDSQEEETSENKRPDPDQDTSPQSLRESNIGLIVVLFLILMVGIGSGVWWIFRNGQEFLGPEASTSAPPPQPTPTQVTSEPQEPATSTQATSGSRGSVTPTPLRANSRQPVPIKPRKFDDFEVKDTGSDDIVTYWTAKKGRFFIIGHLPGGSVEAYTKGLKGMKSIGGVTCGTNDFGGYECFSQVHGGVGRVTMGPSGTLDELTEISRTFYEAWK